MLEDLDASKSPLRSWLAMVGESGEAREGPAERAHLMGVGPLFQQRVGRQQ